MIKKITCCQLYSIGLILRALHASVMTVIYCLVLNGKHLTVINLQLALGRGRDLDVLEGNVEEFVDVVEAILS